MGNKIITENDFWMCSSGAMPAQFQGIRKSTKTTTGEIYITIEDKSTSSWIDFGCTKSMLLYALIAAVVIVAAVIIVAAVVATGGVALGTLMLIGAAAGAFGGLIGAVEGALLCGQKMAAARNWVKGKSDLVSQGAKTITGDCIMQCKAGGVITFAPNIKSWTGAIALGGLNYITELAGCALGGMMVGLGGGVLSGSVSLAAPTLGSVWANVLGSFGIGSQVTAEMAAVAIGSRVLFGSHSLANEYAAGKVNSVGDAATSFGGGAVPEAGSIARIVTGHPQPSDALLLLYLLHLKAPPKQPANENTASPNKNEATPVEEPPVEKPVEEQPVDEQSAEEQPVDEPPADEPPPDEPPPDKPPLNEPPPNEPEGGEKRGGYKAFEQSPEETLIAKVLNKALELVATMSGNARGPCLSGIYDPATGETFFGQNFKNNATGAAEYNKWLTDPPELGGADPIIKAKIQEYEAKIKSGEIVPSEKADQRLGAHSEIRAYDQALKARRAAGLPVDENSVNEMMLHNRDLQNGVVNSNGGVPPVKPRCENCNYIVDGINVIGHN